MSTPLSYDNPRDTAYEAHYSTIETHDVVRRSKAVKNITSVQKKQQSVYDLKYQGSYLKVGQKIIKGNTRKKM